MDLTFILQLKEQVSGGMQKIASSTHAAFRSVDNVIAHSQRNLNRYAKGISDVSSHLSNMRKQLSDVNWGAVVPKIANIGKGINAVATSDLTDAAIRGARYTVNAGLKGDMHKLSFETLAGKERGGQLYNDVTNLAQKSIFGNELYDNAQTMLAFGQSVEGIMPKLKQLGDISMGDKERLANLTLAYSNTATTGKLNGQDLTQYINAGFNPLQELVIMTGRQISELNAASDKGQISATMVAKAIEHATGSEGRYYQMTENIGETPLGKIGLLKAQIDNIALRAGKIITPPIGEIISGVIMPVLNELSGQMEPVVGQMADTIKELAPYIMSLFKSTLGLLEPVIDVLTSAGFKGLAEEAMKLSTSLGEILKPVVEDLALAMEAALKIIAPAVGLLNVAVKSVHNDFDVAGVVDGYEKHKANMAALSEVKNNPLPVMKQYDKGLYNQLYVGDGVNVNPDNPFMANLIKKHPPIVKNTIPSLPAWDSSGAGKSEQSATKVINIKMEALNKSTYHINGTKQAANDTVAHIQDGLLRLMGSLGHSEEI